MRRALISVYNKTEVARFARQLAESDFEIVSTGGTATLLREEGIPVTDVSQVTGFPECLDGRLKTLHPKILGGILARDTKDDRDTLAKLNIAMFDLVVVNLYPFVETIEDPRATEAQIIEMIDIGGPTMIRAAAKNYNRVTVIVDHHDYGPVLMELYKHDGNTTLETRRSFMEKAFRCTSQYDDAIYQYFWRRSMK